MITAAGRFPSAQTGTAYAMALFHLGQPGLARYTSLATGSTSLYRFETTVPGFTLVVP